MKRWAFLLWFQIVWTPGFSSELPFLTSSEAIHIQSANLVVQWNVVEYPWPKTVSVYHVATTRFSPQTVSNLTSLGPFTDKKDQGADGLSFSGPGHTLDISFSKGEVKYQKSTRRYGPTDLAIGVPPTNRLRQLTLNFLPILGIGPSEIAKDENGQPKITWRDDNTDYTAYIRGTTIITNIEYRGVGFRRAVGGLEFLYSGGHGAIDYGEHSEIIKIDVSWPSLERDESYAAAGGEKMIQWIREGKAFQKHMPDNRGGELVIDWKIVKSLSISRAKAYYWVDPFFAGPRNGRLAARSIVYPYAELSGIVDTGTAKLDVDIVCPIIDETKPLEK